MSIYAPSWRNVGILLNYWVKEKFTKTALFWMFFGEVVSIVFTLFAGSTFLAFSSRFGRAGGTQLSEASLGLVLGLYLVGLIQSGFNGAGFPVTSADVNYVFTAPVKTSETFTAKILLNSISVLLAFPPIFVLYLRSSQFYSTPFVTAVAAGLVTLFYFLIGVFLSADVTLSLSPNADRKISLLKNVFIGLVIAISLVPLTLVFPGAPPSLLNLIRILPSGLVAEIGVGLVSGLGASTSRILLDSALVSIWFVVFLLAGVKLSRGQFYELLEVTSSNSTETRMRGNEKRVTSELNPTGKSVWSVVSSKERIVMRRTKEARGLLFNAFILSVFLVIYSLAGTFQSSPTSFLFILFIIGSFGSGNASSWIEKERLWILKTSAISMRKYVKHVFAARVLPLLIYLLPAIVVVGGLLIPGDQNRPALLLSIVLALVAAGEIAAINMGGSMFFASKYSQSTNDDILTSQSQDLSNIRRFLYQTIINLTLVSPLMLLVLGSRFLVSVYDGGSIVILGAALALVSVGYTFVCLNALLNWAGDSIVGREDL